MTNIFVKLLPNVLTTLRLILALPISLLILNENYPAVLWLALLAGLSDGIDGYLARRFNALTYYGAVVDPLADKVLLLSTYIAFAVIGLLAYWIVAIVIIRDLLIISGALIYRSKFGRFKMVPSLWGKISTVVQISFALMLIMQQVYPVLPEFFLQIAMWIVVVLAFISGSHYFYTWRGKIITTKKTPAG
jgi:cardiolipin synthase